MLIQGFVKLCLYCESQYADFDSPMPPLPWKYLTKKEKIMRTEEFYEYNRARYLQGMCHECSSLRHLDF